MCEESVLEERRDRSEHLARAVRFSARMYAVGLVPRLLGMTLCMLCVGGPCHSAFKLEKQATSTNDEGEGRDN